MDLGLVLRAVVSLVVVFVVIALVARTAQRHSRPRHSSGVEILGRVPLTRNTAAVSVRFHDEELLVGVSETNVQVLTSRPWTPTDPAAPTNTVSTSLDGTGLEQQVQMALTPRNVVEKLRHMTTRFGTRP